MQRLAKWRLSAIACIYKYIQIYIDWTNQIIFAFIHSTVSFISISSIFRSSNTTGSKDDKIHWVKWSSANFHFFHFRKERHRNVPAMGPDFLSVVQSCKVWFPNDVKLFSGAQFANLLSQGWMAALDPKLSRQQCRSTPCLCTPKCENSELFHACIFHVWMTCHDFSVWS